MLIVPATIVRSRRLRWPEPQSTTPAGLMVIGVENVVYDEPVLSVTLVFNTTADDPLVNAPLDPAKWTSTYQGGGFTGYEAGVAAFDRINVLLQGAVGPGGASTVSYAADPSDVSDEGGRELAAFVGFPIG